jgi:DNA-binding SARP family transcriptional activator
MFRRPEISPLSRLMFYWLEAARMNMSGLYDRCRKVVSEGLDFADAAGVHLMDLLLLGHGALCCMHRGDVPEAKAFLRRMTFSLTAAKPWEASFYHLLAGWHALHQADHGEAFFHSGQSLALSEEVGNPWTEALACLQGAIVHHDLGRAREAGALLERAGRLGRESGMRFVDFVSLLTGAFFSLAKGEEEKALLCLRQGLEIGQEKGYGGLYLWRPGMLETLCARALEEGIQVPYVTKLVRKADLVPDDARRDLEGWPWPLKIFLFERFRLEKEGRELRFPGKIQQKPLMLLKALVASGGKDVPAEQVIDLLWPEADGDLGHQSLATTLSRLRRLLGNDRVVRIREGRLTLDDRHCWVDAWAFERALEKSGTPAADRKRRPEAMRLLTRATDLYKGAFLPGEKWAHATRERLRGKFIRAIVELGGMHENDGDWSKATACYQKGLETDPLAEGIYRRLIACHIRRGENSEAVAVYRRCRETLSSVLGVAPSPETERLVVGVRPSPQGTC